MNFDNYQNLKADLLDSVFQPAAPAFAASLVGRATAGNDIGIGAGKGRHPGDVRVAIRSPHDDLLQLAESNVPAREADLVKIEVEAYDQPPSYFQDKRRPLEAGVQIGLAGGEFVGTLTGIFRDKATMRRMGATNWHVLRPGRKGDVVCQPGNDPADAIGVVENAFPVEPTGANYTDITTFWIDDDVRTIVDYNEAVFDYQGVIEARVLDLGRVAGKPGRTTGTTRLEMTVFDLDGLRIAYEGFVAVMLDAHEWVGVMETGSQPGDSGSIIGWVEGPRKGFLVGHLAAGGLDSNGIDRTYSLSLVKSLHRAGIELITS